MAGEPKAYAIDCAEGVSVHLDDSSDDETFELTVLKDGEEVEKHEKVTADSITELNSEHFSTSHIDAPTAPADDA